MVSAGERRAAASHHDVVRAAGDVLLPPLHHQDVFALLFKLVADVVEAVAQVLDQDLLTGDLGPVHPNQ